MKTTLKGCHLLILWLSLSLVSHGQTIDFNRDVRPILSDNCFHCHGPDSKNQKSDFRLDSREAMLEGVTPGNLDDSEVFWRIHSEDEDELMPPPDSHRVLSEKQKTILEKWIEQGAVYDKHWAFKVVKRPDVPEIEGEAGKWIQNPIDAFVLRRLNEHKISPSPKADWETLFRRTSLVLTGMLPPLESMDRFLDNSPSQASYLKEVEQLFDSMGYAERQTLRWLDAARYADTDGYQSDDGRENWPWRDWVIQAFHNNMPFDQFTIEQLAGDLLPEPTDQQILATAFNRNHRQNSEGGALAPEFLVENVIDRVETTSTVWLGLTMGCARCHDHKYDPLSQKEFFQMFAYFNNIGERGIGKGIEANPIQDFSSPFSNPPKALLEDFDKAKKQHAEVTASAKQRMKEWIAEVRAPNKSAKSDPDQWNDLTVLSTEVIGEEGQLEQQSDGSLLFVGDKANPVYVVDLETVVGQIITAIRIEALTHPSFAAPRKLSKSSNGNFVLTDINILADGKSRTIGRGVASFAQENYPVANAFDADKASGWAVNKQKANSVSAYFILAEPIIAAEQTKVSVRLAFESQFAKHNIGRFKLSTSDQEFSTQTTESDLPDNVVAALSKKDRSKEEQKRLNNYFKKIDETQKQSDRELKKVRDALKSIGAEPVPVMVMREREGEPLPTYLLDRGQYDAPDKSEQLSRAVPAVLIEDQPNSKQPKDRLELAKWIVSKQNPLTARVVVNRIWQDHFGVGIVKTSEDFGLQSELPSHPDLLDWLASEFVDSGWDLRHIHRLIVTSATFQQQSNSKGGERYEHDPNNRLLARGLRYRLDGFSIRDLALKSAGLLDEKVGGPPVKPYQPEGLWNAVAGNANIQYKPSAGQALYRKSLYTYWKRAVNPPRQLIFDAGGREACNVSIKRTNTPLQALVLMNDVTFLESARNLAQNVILAEPDKTKRLKKLYRSVTALTINEQQRTVLNDSLKYYTNHFRAKPEQASQFLQAGESPRDASIPETEHAAWMAIAHVILNLDVSISAQ